MPDRDPLTTFRQDVRKLGFSGRLGITGLGRLGFVDDVFSERFSGLGALNRSLVYLGRILLSSLEGAAVTHIRLKGADHEFSSLQGVMEDVNDIIDSSLVAPVP